jgi:hypothetical protein
MRWLNELNMLPRRLLAALRRTGQTWHMRLGPLTCGNPVEVRGFEPLASAVRRQRSTGLSYTPRPRLA